MSYESRLRALVRGLVTVFDPDGSEEGRVQMTRRGEMLTAAGLPPKSELTRLGLGWETAIATANAFTYVAVWPTTRAELVLVNNEPAGGKSYLIDSAWMVGLTSMGAAQPIALLGQLVPAVVTKPSNDTAQLLSSRSGKANYGGNAIKAVANTTAGQTTNLWRILTSGLVPAPTTNLGASLYAELYGGYIVPPQGVFALAGLAGTAAGTASIGVSWFEVQLDLP